MLLSRKFKEITPCLHASPIPAAEVSGFASFVREHSRSRSLVAVSHQLSGEESEHWFSVECFGVESQFELGSERRQARPEHRCEVQTVAR